MSAVIIVVHVVSRVGQEIPPIVDVNEAVRVIIYPIVWDLMMVDPDVALEVGMCVVNAGVYHTHHNLVRSGASA